LVGITIIYTNNWKRLSVPCYFLAPCDKRKHTADGLRCCNRYIQCQRSLTAKSLKSRPAMTKVCALYGRLCCGWLGVVCTWWDTLRWDVGVAGWAQSLHSKQLGAMGGARRLGPIYPVSAVKPQSRWLVQLNINKSQPNIYTLFWRFDLITSSRDLHQKKLVLSSSKTRKNWVPAFSDEDLVMRSKRQNKVGLLMFGCDLW